MLNKSLNHYCLLKTVSPIVCNYNSYISSLNKDKVFDLKYPKVIIDLTMNKLEMVTSLMPTKNLSSDINQGNGNINSSYKIDKKYKNGTNLDNRADNKKNKNKVTKKNRRNITLDKDDIFIDKNDNLFDNSSIDISLTKSNKFNKNKKKNKNSLDSVDFSNDMTSNSKTVLNDINKNVILNYPLSIQELADKLNLPEAEIITYLFLKGISTTINQVIDISIAKEVAENYNFNIIDQEYINSNNAININQRIISQDNYKRAPIITIFGHVDHGKTSLLDSILKTNFVNQEYGGITQAISGHEIKWLYNNCLLKLVFLDTPGHEAFTAMRLRGAQVTDIVLLVIAADDGLRPQSIEAINYILEMQLSYIVVINKIDKEGIDVLKIKEELAKYNIVDKELGGNAEIIEVSALTGENIDSLLSDVCVLTEKKNLLANSEQLAQGTILESYLDKQKGVIADIIVQNGTLKIGDFIISGRIYGKVKSIINSSNVSIKYAEPSSIVQVLGFNVVPQAGVEFHIANTEKEAKQDVNYLSNSHKTLTDSLKSLNTRVTSSNHKLLKQMSLIIKTNTLGSLEAIINSFAKISQKKVQINIISANSGNISSTDIDLALTTHSLIVGFKIELTSHLNNLVKKNQLILKNFNVIYDLLDYIQDYMLNLTDIEYREVFIGSATVQTVFSVNKCSVAGCLVNEGKLKRMSMITVYRQGEIVYKGRLESLKRIKDDVEEVSVMNECGVMCDYNLWESLDIIKAYDLIEEPRSL